MYLLFVESVATKGIDGVGVVDLFDIVMLLVPFPSFVYILLLENDLCFIASSLAVLFLFFYNSVFYRLLYTSTKFFYLFPNVLAK